jgi:hypothetical protein
MALVSDLEAVTLSEISTTLNDLAPKSAAI